MNKDPNSIKKTKLFGIMQRSKYYEDDNAIVEAIVEMAERVEEGQSPEEVLIEEGFDPDEAMELI